jgi:pimeloyl-ACP methyl ester carboxylesterase
MKTVYQGASVCYGTGSGHPEANARTIVFIHGGGFDHSVWVMPARFFARHGFRVIAPDLPAHGSSEGAALTSIDAMADWVAGLLRQEAPGPAVIAGHSMGSLVAMKMASQYPDLVERLVLLGTAAPMPVGPPLLHAAEDNHHAAIDMANTWSHSSRGSLGASEVPGVSNLNSGERLLERMPEGAYYADLAACNAFDAQMDLASTPVLVIAGGDDRMTPARSGLQVAGSLPQAETVLLQGCGHSMLSEQPNQVLDAMADFILER